AGQAERGGEADLADQADLGETAYDDVISTLDATSSDQPLIATNKIDRITLTWGAPGIGQIRRYLIFRSDPAHPAPIQIASVNGAPPATTYDDVGNDLTNARSPCAATSTCYNTVYTYFIRSVDVNGTESSPSNKARGEVKHLFVIADNQAVVYGRPVPAFTSHIYGDIPGSLSQSVSCPAGNPAPINVSAPS